MQILSLLNHVLVCVIYIAETNDATSPYACWVCKIGKVRAHQCVKCSHFVHVFCGSPAPGYTEGYGQKVVCFRCQNKHNQGHFLLFDNINFLIYIYCCFVDVQIL